MKVKVSVTIDNDSGTMEIHSEPRVDPFGAAVVLSQGVTQCLAADSQQRALVINPNRPGGGLRESNLKAAN